MTAAPPRLEGFEFVRLLGSGGFADVWLCDQQRPRRQVAVKVLRAGLGAAALAAFESEANLMAALSTHSSIVTIFGADIADGRPYLVMEYCPMPPLSKRIEERPLSVPNALEIAIHLAGAVETAHRAGIVHRDIKPANILTLKSRRSVLTDFGISSAADAQTQTGLSPAWAPPEQLRDERTGPAGDVYSLGATLYAMLAGHSPFLVPGARNDLPEITHRVLNEQVPALRRSDVPTSLHRLLLTAMARTSTQRYPSALAFGRALQGVQLELSLSVTDIEYIDDSVQAEEVVDTAAGATRVKPLTVVDPELDEPGPGDTGATMTASSTAPSTGSLSPGYVAPDFTGPSLPPLVVNDTMTGLGQALPHQTDLPAPDPQSSTPVRPGTPQPDEPVVPQRSSRPLAIAAGVSVLVLAAAGGAFAMLSGPGQTANPTTTTSEPAPVDAVGDTVAAVTDVTGSPGPDGVTFTWTSPFPEDGDTFLYRVIDPIDPVDFAEVAGASVTVPADPGRTCIEVVVRRANGQASEPTPGCAETPVTQP